MLNNDDNRDPVARAQIEGHIDVCTERYGNLWSAVSELKRDLSALSNRLFAIVIGTCSATFLGLAALIFYELTKGKL